LEVQGDILDPEHQVGEGHENWARSRKAGTGARCI
jgi:hypothetical protein